MSSVKKIKGALAAFSPEEQAFAKDYAKTRLEVKMLKSALSTSQQQYASLFLFMLAVLRQMPEHEIRFTAKDLEAYEHFKDAWTIAGGYDEETDEEWLRLVEKGVGDGVVG